MFLSIERYLAIIKPLKYNESKVMKRLPFLAVGMWIVIFVLSYPDAYYSTVINGICQVYVNMSAFMAVFITPYYLVLAAIFPAAIMLFCYTSIGISLARNKFEAHTSQNSTTGKTKKSLIKKAQVNILQTCITLMVVFILCWVFNMVILGMYIAGNIASLQTDLYHISVALVICNSCINPFVYTLRYREFKFHLKKLFCPKLVTSETPPTLSTGDRSDTP